MGRYYSYGQRVDEAFKAARSEYMKVYEELKAAEKENSAANEWYEEKTVGERDRRKARAALRLYEAKADMEKARREIWPRFSRDMEELGRQLAKEVEEKFAVSPEAIDNNALELLKSGIMTAADMEALIVKYEDNPTMTRLIGKYAKDAAAELAESISEADRASRARFTAVANFARDNVSSILKDWDALMTIADTCNGQRHEKAGNRQDPAYIANMSKKWEELSANTLAVL